MFHSQEIGNGIFFEVHVLHFNWQRTRVMDSCGFKVTYGGGEKSCDCAELVSCSFHYFNKKYDTGSKAFQIIFVVFL